MNAAIMFGNHSNYPTSPSVASTYSNSSSSSELSQNSSYSSISLSYLSPNSHHSSSQDNAMGTPRKSSSVQDFYLQKSANSSSTWPNQTSSKSSPTGALILTGRSRHSRSGKSKRRQHDHQHQFHQRHAANLRERKRMQSINDAFEGLRERIPTLPYEKRLSKVDTLRLAIGYISFLGELVRTGGSSLQLNGGTFPGRYCPIPPPIKKVVLKSQQTGPNGDELEQHSLSWESDENKRPGVVQHGNVLIAKVWTPEDPRGPNQPNLDNNFDKAQQQQQTIAQSTPQKAT